MTQKTGKDSHNEASEKPKTTGHEKTAAAGKPDPKSAVKKPDEPAAGKKKPASTHHKGGSGLTGLVALLALLLSLGLGGAAWYSWQQMQVVQQQLATKAEISEQQTAGQKLSLLAEQQNRISQLLDQLRIAQERITRLPSNNNWLDIEALIQLAVDRMQLNRDVDGAITALQWANQRLGKLGEPGLASLQRQIARDIKALQAVNQPDFIALDKQIQQITSEAGKLSFRTAAPHNLLKDDTQKPVTDTTQETRGWKRLLTDALKELKPLVTIRRKHEVTQPMLTAEEAVVIQQILQLRLERVRMQVALKNQAGYEHAISEVLQWMQQHYRVDDETYKKVVKSLQDLRSVQLQPALPDINGSLRELRAYRALLQGKSS